MEAALARLGAAYLCRAIERSQFQHDKDSSLSALLKSLSPEHGASALFDAADEIVENPTNTSEAFEASGASEPPAAPTRARVLKPTSKPYVCRTLVSKSYTFGESDLFRTEQSTTLEEQYLRWRQIRVEDDQINKLRHRDKLWRQLNIGRRWAVAIDWLSHGMVILAGKELSTLV